VTQPPRHHRPALTSGTAHLLFSSARRASASRYGFLSLSSSPFLLRTDHGLTGHQLSFFLSFSSLFSLSFSSFFSGSPFLSFSLLFSDSQILYN
jgi:hypothetical protein